MMDSPHTAAHPAAAEPANRRDLLRHGPLSYMGSERFRPAVELDPALLRRWLG